MQKGTFCNRVVPMKNRDYKSFAPGEYYHVFNRGNAKMDIFRTQADYAFFLSRLKEYLFPDDKSAPTADGKERYVRKTFPPGSFSLVCYCLMPNHFHLVIRQNGDVPVSALMLSLISGYSKYFNKVYKRVGSVFQDQFKSVRVESNEQLLWLSAYVHQNPQAAGLVDNLSKYPHSSYLDYIDLQKVPFCEREVVLEQFQNPAAYREYVEETFEVIKGKKELEELLLD